MSEGWSFEETSPPKEKSLDLSGKAPKASGVTAPAATIYLGTPTESIQRNSVGKSSNCKHLSTRPKCL